MTVIKSKRAESDMQFLATARELLKFSLEKCKSEKVIPKSYRFFLALPLSELANKVYDEVRAGNKIYPLNQHEAQIRRDHFMAAEGYLDAMVGKVEISYELIHYNESVLHEWARLISEELRLLAAVRKKDRERYKNLPM